MKFNFPLNNFASGEWSPKMLARTETDQYPKSCEQMLNMITQIQGGAAFRGGFTNHELNDVAETGIATELAQSFYPNYGGDTYPEYGYKCIPLMGTSQQGVLVMRGVSAAAGVPVDSGGWYCLLPNSPAAISIKDVVINTSVTANPILSWNPLTTQWVQIGDVLVLADGEGTHEPVVVRFSSPDTFTVYSLESYVNTFTDTNVRVNQVIPWSKIYALSIGPTMNPSATTGSITITAGSSFFDSSMVGAYIRFCNGTSADGVARITAYTSGTSVSATVIKTLPNAAFVYGSTTNASSFWQISAWNNSYGFPRTVTAFQGRLIFGGNRQSPDTVWGSRISNHFMFEEIPSPDTTGAGGFADASYTADNSRPFTITPNSQEASNIVAMSSAKTLTIHTEKSEIVAYGSDGALGANNVVFESSTSYGASAVQPVRVNNFLTFVQGNGRKVRDIIFNFQEDQYKSTDLSFIAEHLFRSTNMPDNVLDDTVVEMASVQGDSSVLFLRTDQRRVLYVTLDRDYQINAWGSMAIGKGDVSDVDIYGEDIVPCEAIFTYPHPITQEETLWAVMVRGTSAAPLITFECLNPMWDRTNPIVDPTTDFIVGRCPVYLDYAKILVDLTAATGNWELGEAYANQVVSIVGDGNYLGEATADGDGDIVLPNTAECRHLVVGFLYEGILITAPIEAGGQIGPPQGRYKKIDELVIKFFNSAGCLFGPAADRLDEIPFRENDQPMSEGIAYFTGEKVVDFPAGYDRTLQVMVKQNKPYPMHVVAVIPRGVTYD